MTLEAFDADRHHVGLGETGDADVFGFILSGGYEVRGQAATPPANDFGGQRDLIGAIPAVSRWTQDDFSGGVYRENWGKDIAAFSSSQNVLPMRTEKSVRSVPPLTLFANSPGTTATSDLYEPVHLFAASGYLWSCAGAAVDRYDLSDGTVTRFDNPDDLTLDPDQEWLSFAYDAADKILYILKPHKIERREIPTFDVAPIHYYQPPTSITNFLTGFGVLGNLELGRGILLFSSGNRLYRVKIPADIDTDVPLPTDWVYVDRLPCDWVASTDYQGLTYILCGDQDQPATVVSFDGTALIPITSLPYNFEGRSITTYGGRIYVGGLGRDVSNERRNAELYEITGTSVRLVKTFTEESSRTFFSRPDTIDGFGVHEGFLFFGDRGRGLIAYDLTTDAFYNASMLDPVDDLTTDYRRFTLLVSGRSALYIWANHPSDDTKTGLYRIGQPEDYLAVGTFDSIVTTSEFAPEPDRDKRWSQLRVLSRYAAVDPAYSLDGGDTWTDLTSPVVEVRGPLITRTYDLGALPTTGSIRLRHTMTRATSVAVYGELIAFTLTFKFLDSGKLTWAFTINGATNVETADGTDAVDQDVLAITNLLLGYWRAGTPLSLTDVDGTVYNVQLADFRSSQPIVATPTGGGREAFHSLTLLEV